MAATAELGRRSYSGGSLNSAQFLAGFRAATQQLVDHAETWLERVAIDAQNRARRYCPVGTPESTHKPGYVGGRLRASIMHQGGRNPIGPYQDVGTNVNYAPYVEFGTYKMRAQPYLRPGVAEAAAAAGATQALDAMAAA